MSNWRSGKIEKEIIMGATLLVLGIIAYQYYQTTQKEIDRTTWE